MHKKILQWYDKNRRTLPWRAEPGEVPNPYYVYLSEILLQQTTVATVTNYFLAFIERWPTIEDLAKADLDDILQTFQGLGYYSRAKNLAKAAKELNQQKIFPNRFEDLLSYPGIGEYTAKAIASIAFNQPVVPVDGNVIRVFSRVYGLETPLPGLKKEVIEKANTLGGGNRPADFAQALMDLGSLICKPKTPLCDDCPLNKDCIAHLQNLDLPQKAKKAEKKKQHTTALVYYNDDFILIEKNENDGLLSNLWGVPTTPWENFDQSNFEDDIHVTHIFTHIHLSVTVLPIYVDSFEKFGIKRNQNIIKIEDLHQYPLSTLMKKIIHAAFQQNACFNTKRKSFIIC